MERLLAERSTCTNVGTSVTLPSVIFAKFPSFCVFAFHFLGWVLTSGMDPGKKGEK